MSCRHLPWRLPHTRQHEDPGESNALKMLASPGLPRSLPDDEDIPCPRRFGATFAANGSLVVFSSSAEVVRAGRKRSEEDGQQVRERRTAGGEF